MFAKAFRATAPCEAKLAPLIDKIQHGQHRQQHPRLFQRFGQAGEDRHRGTWRGQGVLSTTGFRDQLNVWLKDRIPTRIGTLGFDAGHGMKDATFASGYDAARTYLDRHLRANSLDVQKLLEEIAAILCEYSQVENGKTGAALTVSLARPDNAGTHLIVVNGVNLDPEHVGARLGVHVTLAGQAFQMRQPGEYRRVPGTAPHYRIPAHMEEMLCRPVNPKTAGNNPAVAAAPPLGVLSTSSGVAFIDALRKNDPDLIEALLTDVADSLAELLETGQMSSTLDLPDAENEASHSSQT